MKKFACSGCGGSLKESGKFYVCENCGTKYVLGKDDEGNPFTYIPIEKKELTHGEIAHKATQISVNTISVREIKLSDNIVADVNKEALSLDTQSNIQVIQTYLKAREWDAAQRQINQLLLENNSCAEAQWLGLMCERKNASEIELLRTFSNFTEADKIRLDKMLSNSSPSFAKHVLDLLFEGAYANDTSCCSILSLILPYARNESVYSPAEYSNKTAYSFGKIIEKSFCNSFDYLIAYALNPNEVDKYIYYVEQFADKISPKISKKYYAKILAVDPANINVHRKLVNADIVTDETLEKRIADFENLLKYSPDTDKETYGIISSLKSSKPVTSSKSEFMWNILGYHSAAPEGLKTEILEYAFALINASLWNQARNYLNLILSFDVKNADAYWGLCLVGLQARNYDAVKMKNENLIDRPEFAKCLSLYQSAGNKSQADKLMALTKKQKSAKKAKKVGVIVGICIAAFFLLCIGGVGVSYFLKAQEKDKAAAVVEDYLKAATNGDSDAMDDCVSSKCKDNTDLETFLNPEMINIGILSFDQATPSDLSDSSLEQLTEASEYFCQCYVSSYDLREVTRNGDGTYTVEVKANIIDLESFDNAYVVQHEQIFNDIGKKYQAEVDDINATAKTHAEAVMRLYDLIMPSICKGVKEAVREADETSVVFKFTVGKMSGKYVITEINY